MSWWRAALAPLLTVALVAGCTPGRAGGVREVSPPSSATIADRRGGVLRILNQRDVDYLDPAMGITPTARALMRAYTRSLYGFRASADDSAAEPVPDLASEPAEVSEDGRTYTFRLREGVHFAQPVNREIVAADFVYAIQRQLRGPAPSRPYLELIKGARSYARGRARRVTGLEVLDDHVLRITLRHPTPEFLSIVALPYFAPLPREQASRYRMGLGYSPHVVGSGPYTVAGWDPGQSITLVRNRNWEPESDPLRSAWVDRIEVEIGLAPDTILERIEDGEADLSLDGTVPPPGEVARLSQHPTLSEQFSVKPLNCVTGLVLRTDGGPTADLAVRQALNLAVDKAAAVNQAGGPYAGEVASSVLPPTLRGYAKFDLYPSVGARGDVDRARELLQASGYGEGVTLTVLADATGSGDRVADTIRASAARARIYPEVEAYPYPTEHLRSLEIATSEGKAFHAAMASWCADYPGSGALGIIGLLLTSSRLGPPGPKGRARHDVPELERQLEAVLAEADPERRTELWGQLDRAIMERALVVPLFYERGTYFWSARVRGWVFSPWTANPDLTNLWLAREG